MAHQQDFEVIIVGGSYAGLAAAMTLGRSLRKVLVLDSQLPCNRQTPHSHNFLTHDGEVPAAITARATEQVLRYDSVQLRYDKAIEAGKEGEDFWVRTESGGTFRAPKVLFTTGVWDQMPAIEGFSDCWGISVLHCPYCHGYEVSHEALGVLANGEKAFDYVRLIHHWSHNLALFTNGPSQLTADQTQHLDSLGIDIVQPEVTSVVHENGYLSKVLLSDGSSRALRALYAHVPFVQHCDLPAQLGCQLTEQGYIQIDDFHTTTVPGVYAAGDNTTPMRAVWAAVAAGHKVGVFINTELIKTGLSEHA
ncbi:FAD-dependent oxidoreductase [Rhabdobacter roseus]